MTDASDPQEPPLEDRRLGPSTTALLGAEGGKYPDANALLVEGGERTMLVDAGLGVIPRLDRLPPIDLVVLSHCHEDHIPALPHFENAECWVHEADLPGMLSLDGFLDIFGHTDERREKFKSIALERFSYQTRPNALAFEGDHVWDLGGVTVQARHAPGHTRGHCVLEIQPDDVLFLGDIDLSGFGPYYGDAWSDLESFEQTLENAQTYQNRWYVSGHHIGVVDHSLYSERLSRYRARIEDRERRLLDFLSEPRALDEIVAHRFVYRPHDEGAGIDQVERRSMGLHLERLVRDGRVVQAPDRRYCQKS